MKFKCPKCEGKKFVRDQKSIRCLNVKCMYHLTREEKQLYLSAKRKHKKKLNNNEKYNKILKSNRLGKYRTLGLKKGSLTLKQAAKLKGTTTSKLYNHLSQLNVTRKPLRIVYDSKLIKLKIFRRKKCLR